MIKLGFLYSRIRKEEKLLMEEIRRRSNIELVKLFDPDLIFEMGKKNAQVDVVLERAINHSRALYALKMYNDLGIPSVNSYEVARICGDKLLTSAALIKNNIPTPRVMIAFTPESALKAMDKIGYPCVLKPAVGSWGRLVSKVNDREAAETILEHKQILGSYHHSIFYIQEYVPKPQNRDIRSFVIGDECVTAIYRKSDHWITNTQRGGISSDCPVNGEITELSLKAAHAVGGDVVAVDLFETPTGLKVNEVNYTMEFRNSILKVDIPKKIIDYVLGVVKK